MNSYLKITMKIQINDKQALKNEKAIYQGKNPYSFCLQNARHARHMYTMYLDVLRCFDVLLVIEILAAAFFTSHLY